MPRLPLRAISYSGFALLGAAAVVWTMRSSFAASPRNEAMVQSVAAPQPSATVGDELPTLAFAELIQSSPKLGPSDKAQSLNGKRIRVVGYMAEMEEPMVGGFYLVPQPIHLDESGGGTGDLPLQTILVDIPGAVGKSIPHVRGALVGVGVFDVGNRSDSQGRVSNFRLHLDADARLTPNQTVSASATDPTK